MDHTSTLLLSESIHITPQGVSHLLTSHERQKITPHADPLNSELFTIPSGSYSCIYPLGIEYAGTVEKVEVEIEIEIETKVTLRQEPTKIGRDGDRRRAPPREV